MRCPITGEAVIQTGQEEGSWVWLQADPEIHVAVELLTDADESAFLTERYEIGERCPYFPNAAHARLRDAGSDAS